MTWFSGVMGFPVSLNNEWNYSLLDLKKAHGFPIYGDVLCSIAATHPGTKFVQHQLQGFRGIVKGQAASRILGVVLLKNPPRKPVSR